MIQEGGSIISGEREDFLFTYDEGEKQQHDINRETAKLVYDPEFIPLKPKFLDIFTSNEAIILSFISFYKKNGTGRMYFTNAQFAQIARCSEDVVSKAISKFIKMGYIKVSRKIKSGGGQIRFINEYNETPEGEKLRLRKKLSPSKEKQGTNNNKINKNNISNNINILPNSNEIGQKDKNGLYFSTTKYIKKLEHELGIVYDDIEVQRNGHKPYPKPMYETCMKIVDLCSRRKIEPVFIGEVINKFHYMFTHQGIEVEDLENEYTITNETDILDVLSNERFGEFYYGKK